MERSIAYLDYPEGVSGRAEAQTGPLRCIADAPEPGTDIAQNAAPTCNARSTTNHAHTISRFILVVCLTALISCGMSGAPKQSVHEVAGSDTERVAVISAIITKHRTPPSSMIDAHFMEEQTGEGDLGPSDFRSFCFIQVESQAISQWTQALTPLGAAAEYDAPAQPRDWWVSREEFASLQFFKPDILTGRTHGWIGISSQAGRIYFFTFTM